jgi:hypothetical protein
MRCKACDCGIEGRMRNVTDEDSVTHNIFEDLCSYCVQQSELRYNDDDLKDIYQGLRHANFKTIC